MVTCYSSRNYTELLNNHPCLFTVKTVVCDDIVGDTSVAVTVSNTGVHTQLFSIIMHIISLTDMFPIL